MATIVVRKQPNPDGSQEIVDYSSSILKYDERFYENVSVAALPIARGERGQWIRNAQGDFVKLSPAVLEARFPKHARKALIAEIAQSSLDEELKIILRKIVQVL